MHPLDSKIAMKILMLWSKKVENFPLISLNDHHFDLFDESEQKCLRTKPKYATSALISELVQINIIIIILVRKLYL